MKHKYAEVIKAWADGAEIEWLNREGKWETIHWPSWGTNAQYRVKPKADPYAELKAAHAAGKTIQCYSQYKKDWVTLTDPTWGWEHTSYRIKPEVDPYAELKAAWKAGKTIQVKTGYSDWIDTETPGWFRWNDYRVKPEPQHTYYSFNDKNPFTF